MKSLTVFLAVCVQLAATANAAQALSSLPLNASSCQMQATEQKAVQCREQLNEMIRYRWSRVSLDSSSYCQANNTCCGPSGCLIDFCCHEDGAGICCIQ